MRNLETSVPIPQVWVDYRQALRDLPGEITDPATAVWPELPA
ncbi:phage tail assembly chaperone [Devosia sp. A449]